MKTTPKTTPKTMPLLCLLALVLPVQANAESMSPTDRSHVSVATSGANSVAFADGVSIVNGEITIEGMRVPHDVRRFTAQSGKVYVIERDRDRVSVRSE